MRKLYKADDSYIITISTYYYYSYYYQHIILLNPNEIDIWTAITVTTRMNKNKIVFILKLEFLAIVFSSILSSEWLAIVIYSLFAPVLYSYSMYIKYLYWLRGVNMFTTH